MSETSLCLVFPKSARWIQDYKNSYGSFPAVMAYLLRHEENELQASGFDLRKAQKLELARKNIFNTIFEDKTIPLCLKVCYAACLNGAVIAKPFQGEIGRLLIEGGSMISKALPDNVCHFEKIGIDVQKERIPKNALGQAVDISSIQHTWLYGAWPTSDMKPFCIGSCLGLIGR